MNEIKKIEGRIVYQLNDIVHEREHITSTASGMSQWLYDQEGDIRDEIEKIDLQEYEKEELEHGKEELEHEKEDILEFTGPPTPPDDDARFEAQKEQELIENGSINYEK